MEEERPVGARIRRAVLTRYSPECTGEVRPALSLSLVFTPALHVTTAYLLRATAAGEGCMITQGWLDNRRGRADGRVSGWLRGASGWLRGVVSHELLRFRRACSRFFHRFIRISYARLPDYPPSPPPSFFSSFVSSFAFSCVHVHHHRD